MSVLVIYQSVDDSSIWARPVAEFYDGRFVETGEDRSIMIDQKPYDGYDAAMAELHKQNGTKPVSEMTTLDLRTLLHLAERGGEANAKHQMDEMMSDFLRIYLLLDPAEKKDEYKAMVGRAKSIAAKWIEIADISATVRG
jgi:hypothetical protein